MSRINYYVVLMIISTVDGYAAFEAVEAPTTEAPRRRAMSLAEKHGGALAVSRTGHTSIGEGRALSVYP